MIYSSDEHFNHQILYQKIAAEDVRFSYPEEKYGRELVISARRQEYSHQLAHRIKHQKSTAREKPLSDDLKKKIAASEKHKLQINLRDSPHPSHSFLRARHHAGNYVVPAVYTYLFVGVPVIRLVNPALDYLHSERYRFYNNTSVNDCFFKVFSARPPPVYS